MPRKWWIGRPNHSPELARVAKKITALELLALKGELFWPIKGLMRVGGKSRVEARLYRPILYSIDREPAVGPVSDDCAENHERPRSVTIVFTPERLANSDTATATGISAAVGSPGKTGVPIYELHSATPPSPLGLN